MSAFAGDVLALAFARHVLDGVEGGEPLPDEVIERLCPPAALAEVGLLDGEGQPTRGFGRATEEALRRLPEELTLPQKLDRLTVFFEALLQDGVLELGEGAALVRAANLLGVRASELDAHLDTLTEHVGSLDGDMLEPEP